MTTRAGFQPHVRSVQRDDYHVRLAQPLRPLHPMPVTGNVALVTLAAFLLGSCTIAMWSEQDYYSYLWRHAWPPAHIAYDHIEAAAIDSSDCLCLRITMSRGEPVVYVAPLAKLWRAPSVAEVRTMDDLEAAVPEVVAEIVRDLPASVRSVRIVDRGGIAEFAREVHDRGMSNDPPVVMVELEDLQVLAVSTRRPTTKLRIRLPDPPLDWFSLNVIGHIVATPVFVAFDVVMLPWYGLVALIRAVPTH